AKSSSLSLSRYQFHRQGVNNLPTFFRRLLCSRIPSLAPVATALRAISRRRRRSSFSGTLSHCFLIQSFPSLLTPLISSPRGTPLYGLVLITLAIRKARAADTIAPTPRKQGATSLIRN